MSEATQVIECSGCGRLHQVDPVVTGDRFECECGKSLEVRLESPQAGDRPGSEGDATSAVGSLLAALKKRWKLAAAVALVLVGAAIFFSFWRGPKTSLAHLELGAGGLTATGPKENPEVHLQILEDNARSAEHPLAASILLRMNHSSIVPRLCRIAARGDLDSRTLVVRLLGQKGEDQPLDVLGPLMDDSNKTLSLAAIVAVTRIGSPLAESVLQRVVQMPTRAREALPSIAAVRNDVARRVLKASLETPALRMLAMEEIGKARVSGCVPALGALARNRTILQADRVRSVDTLGELRSAKARRMLIYLTEDSEIGWKARQVLDE